MTTKNLLVELFVEELPPKALKKLGESFANSLFGALKSRGLIQESSVVTSYATPRRLAVHLTDVADVAPDKEEVQKLMPVSVAIGADGKPTAALRKRLAKEGREAMADLWPNAEDGPDQLFVQHDGKVDAVFFRTLASGTTLKVGLEFAIEEALEALPIPKVMTYQLADGWSNVQFVRPAHRLVALHGAEIVEHVSVLGLETGRTTQGHRFEAKAATLDIRDADSYETQLETEGAVIPSFEKRREEIKRQLTEAATKAGAGLKPIEDDALLDEVTALVERPNVLLCRFDEEFLEVPQECLILTMKANQKYFPLLDAAGRLTNQFLVVSNIRPDDPSAVISGNERVIRPRLADAKFFFDQDRKKTLESRVLGLAKVVYHNKLGTQGERVQRVAAIAKAIGQQLGGDALALHAEEAALLAKADLLTDMVGEFPELQGVMGRYYALHDKLPGEIADAIEDHYKPRFAGDGLPRNQAGISVALADKLETLAGLFGIGQIPTGDKDPFALRRHALGVLRMLTEKELPLSLHELVRIAFGAFPHGLLKDNRDGVETFLFDRLGGMMREQGYTAHEVDAVLSMRPSAINLVPKRLEAVRAFGALPEAAALAAANKRIGNILKKEEIDASPDQLDEMPVQESRFKEPAETALYGALNATAPKAEAAYVQGDYTASLKGWAKLKEPVDAFFDTVMVNAEDAALRTNRLALLAHLHAAMNRVADIAKLAA